MQDYAQAAMVEEADLHDGLVTTISRTEVEQALAAEEPPDLVLDITGTSEGTRSIAVAWKRDDLERLLREATGDSIQLTFDRTAIEQALEDDVEAHGLRQKVAILAVALTAVGGVAGSASAMPMSQGGGSSATTQVTSDHGVVNPATGMKVSYENPQLSSTDSGMFSNVSPGAAALGGAAVLAIAGAAFAFGGGSSRRRPAVT